MTLQKFELVIIGSGPAGLTAAIYSARAALSTLVIAGNPSGGQLTTTSEVENFPGFPEGVQGPQLVANMRKQAEKFGAQFVEQNVVKLEKNAGGTFGVVLDSNETVSAKALVIASGANAKWLGLDSEQRLRGKGVSACATCDGFFFKNKIIAVVGGGDSAMEEATYLTKFATKVYVLVRKSKEEMKASKIMQERALANPKIEFLFNREVLEVLGESMVSGLEIKDTQTGKQETLSDVQGLFLAIGHSPNTSYLQGFVDLDSVGYIKITNGTGTSEKGVFSAGDVGDPRYRQAISAAGTGCMAALDAEKYLNSLPDEIK
jgi:thioredoxin reductase (NADPH)